MGRLYSWPEREAGVRRIEHMASWENTYDSGIIGHGNAWHDMLRAEPEAL